MMQNLCNSKIVLMVGLCSMATLYQLSIAFNSVLAAPGPPPETLWVSSWLSAQQDEEASLQTAVTIEKEEDATIDTQEEIPIHFQQRNISVANHPELSTVTETSIQPKNDVEEVITISSSSLNLTSRPRPWVIPSQCLKVCRITVDPRTGRFPTRVNPRGPYLLSNSAYGELADIDYNSWDATTKLMNVSKVDFWNDCLPPVVVIYLYTSRDVNGFWKQMTRLPHNLKRPYIIIATGWVIDFSLKWIQPILKDPNLLRIYASSVEIKRKDPYQVEKVYTIPLGLIRDHGMDQGTGLVSAMTSIHPVNQIHSASAPKYEDPSKPQSVQQHSKLLLVNFSPHNFKSKFRTLPYNHCCNSTETARLNTTCTGGGFYDFTSYGSRKFLPAEWRRASSSIYRTWSQHKYTVAPRGQKVDCYRFWESLYVGSVPIVLRRHAYYRDLLERFFHLEEKDAPILYVDSWTNITKEFLEEQWPRFQEVLSRPEWNTWPPKYLTIDYVEKEIRKVVENAFETRKDTLAQEASQYYDPKDRDWFWKDRRRCHL